MRRILLALVATAIVVATSYTTRTVAPAAEPSTTTNDVAPVLAIENDFSKQPREVPAELSRLIEVFERRTANSNDALDFRTLGSQYLSRASATGVLADYERAAAAFETAYELAPTDRDGRIGYASAAAAIHQFATALELAEAALDADLDDADALALAGDAAVELGKLELAARYYDKLDRALPDHPPVLARLAGYAHLTGDQDGAIALARLALEEAAAASPTSQDVFYPLLLSDLFLDAGAYGQAVVQANDAVELSPRSGIALASLGRALSHGGRFLEAIAAYEQALAIQDDAGWRVAIADLLTAVGDSDMAAEHYQAALGMLESGSEPIFGQSLAALYADLDIRGDESVALAQRNLDRRQSIDAYDTLAWALYRTGRLEEARDAIDSARATGAQDATLLYHSAVIAAAQGDTPHAVAELSELLGRNPGFHPLQGRHAAELLASLAG